MLRAILVAALVAAMQVPGQAWAHTDKQKPAAAAQQSASSPAAPNDGGGTRDARSYFTDLELVTQDGRSVRFYSDVLEGRTVVINVIYTHCKDACPLITQQLNDVRKRIPDLFGKRVFFVTLSSDPLRDSPQAMKHYARTQSADVPGWTFLTGRKENIDQILKRLGLYSADVEAHPTLLIAGNVAAKRWSKIRPDSPAAAIVERLTALAGSTALPGTAP